MHLLWYCENIYMIILYILLFIAHNCVWSSRQFQKISLNIFGQNLNASYSEHCNEIPTIFLPPLHGSDRSVKKHLSVCNIRLGKSHFSSARLYLISQQPLSLIGMRKCLSECLSRPLYRLCSVIFCTRCNRLSHFSHSCTDCAVTQGQNYTNNHKSNMYLVRQVHLLINISDDAQCTWFSTLHVHLSICRVHSCLCF